MTHLTTVLLQILSPSDFLRARLLSAPTDEQENCDRREEKPK